MLAGWKTDRMLRSVFFMAICLGLVASAAPRPVGAAALAGDAPIPFDDSHLITYNVIARPLTASAAPADEYFGHFKISNLGVKNIIHDITIEGNSPLALPKQASRIDAVSSAMADWSDKYPRDNWLPGALVRFATLLQSKQLPLYSHLATSEFYLLEDHYPRTWFAKYAHSQLVKLVELPDVDMLAAVDSQEFSNVIDWEYAPIKR